ncbi:hypothetical protein BDV18DRAFT_129744 [Aspergillus unguis]
MSLNRAPYGLVHGLEDASLAFRGTAMAFLAISLLNSLELLVMICWTFQQRRGLYFWCLLISSVGIIPYSIGWILDFWLIAPIGACLPLIFVGYIAIIPVQSLILYSRLHLVFYYEKFLKILLYVIITYSALLVVSNVTAMFGSTLINESTWNYTFSITERIQVTGFCVQELFLSLLYMYSTVKLLRISPEGKTRAKRILYELLGINAFTIALDIAIIVTEYLDFYSLQVCLKVLVYSIKVKVEFAVLGRLVAITRTRRAKQMDRTRRNSFIGNPNVLLNIAGANADDEHPHEHSEERPASSVTAVEPGSPMLELSPIMSETHSTAVNMTGDGPRHDTGV